MINRKYVFAGLFALAAVLSWNVFLIQRDDALYKAHYRQQATQQMK